MSLDVFASAQAMRREHTTAIRLLTAINEGDDSVMPEIYTFLKTVKARQEAEALATSGKQVRQEKRKKGGRKNSGAFEIAPRYEGGCDYSSSGLVLARNGDLRLVWRSGAKFWADQMTGYTYTPGDLEVLNAKGRTSAHITNNHRSPGTKDTRLSKALILRYAEKIDALFGPGTAEKVAPLKATLLLDSTTPPPEAP